MIRKMFRALSLSLAVLILIATLNQMAQAGPPLICHPLDIGNAKSLPWNGGEWRAIKTDYNVNRLVADTLALLDSDMAVVVRMETLRRASVYASQNRTVAVELHSRLADRARNRTGKFGALAHFDLGYLEETYKQLIAISGTMNFAKNLNGYSSVVKAIALRGGDADMEFAAAMITERPRLSSHDEHFRKAAEGAAEGSLLARNLVTHFSNRGRSMTEIKARLGVAKN